MTEGNVTEGRTNLYLFPRGPEPRSNAKHTGPEAGWNSLAGAGQPPMVSLSSPVVLPTLGPPTLGHSALTAAPAVRLAGPGPGQSAQRPPEGMNSQTTCPHGQWISQLLKGLLSSPRILCHNNDTEPAQNFAPNTISSGHCWCLALNKQQKLFTDPLHTPILHSLSISPPTVSEASFNSSNQKVFEAATKCHIYPV